MYMKRFEEFSRSSQKSLFAPFTKVAILLMLFSGLFADLKKSYTRGMESAGEVWMMGGRVRGNSPLPCAMRGVAVC